MSPTNPESPSRIDIAVMARAPVPGQAKTRLIPRLGAEGAAGMQRWLLQRAVATALIADVGPVSLWCAPDTHHPDFLLCRAFGSVVLHAQPQGDLGARMLAAVAEAPTAAGTLVVGTDCPALTPSLLRHAANRLHRGDDAVIVPAEDGGYVLIGMRVADARAFIDIDWGSGAVLAQTRRQLAATGWRWSELATLWDVDRPDDLDRLAQTFPDAPSRLGVAA